ncbi:SDR family oxidoreductase [Terrabacter terrae]|uniref:SDR family oxidoreductase n=1 Tax=Terrabacter terrae TaxID=318434 RepID=A0ABP5FQ67_9MICO
MAYTIDLSGRVALVTGGTSGIGLATAAKLATAGARVVICGRNAERGRAAVADIGADGLVSYLQADVSDDEQVRELVDAVVREHGRLDIAVNNAGNVETLDPSARTSVEVTPSHFDATIRTLMTSAWLCMRHEIPAMIAGDPAGPGAARGAVVNVSSMDAALLAAGTGSYSAAKLGLEALTVSTAKEFAARGVRINAVRPGAILTPMLERNLRGDSPQERAERVAAYEAVISMRRLGEPREVASVITWLCSDEASYVTGQVLNVDGAISL